MHNPCTFQKLKAKQKRDDRDNEESLPDKESEKKRKDEVTEKKKEPKEP